MPYCPQKKSRDGKKKLEKSKGKEVCVVAVSLLQDFWPP